ncbi:non-ribosomal peptide synthetase, partial [Longimicrobium sp.]|uniref:non-ribosomal peptide synthetase n=1 Tax=Longimicrobium sp. TaxID=2029185 RepID=UPI002E3025F3
VRWRPDGAVEYLGRLDFQVKIRGFRVEPGEVEAALREDGRVRQAVVVAREDAPGARRLVAYVVGAEGGALPVDDVRARLRERLPEHMVPAAFVVLDALPLNASGKVDRRALPAPAWSGGAEHVAPRTEAQSALCEVWAQVLGVERVGIEENFFALGGDSILAIQVAARARARGLDVAPRQVFERPTVARLAEVAGRAGPGAGAAQGPVTGSAPLTPIQHRFFHLPLPARHHYNQALLLVPRAPLDPARLEQAVAALVTHHDALRLRFHADASGAWTQAHASPGEHAPVERVRLAHLAEADQPAAIEAHAERTQRGLDLADGPLLRVVSFDLGEGRPERLLIVIHHLVVDGVSWRILLEDLETAYDQLSRGESIRLPEKTTSWQAWARALADSAAEVDPGEAAYWLAEAEREVAPLPLDDPSAPNTVARWRRVAVRLDAAETEALLRAVPRAYRTGMDDVLLCALAQALERWTGSPRVRVELEGHGREEDRAPGVDLSRTVGWFTSLYPVVLDVADARDAGAALRMVKEQLRAVPGRGMGHGLLRWMGAEDVRRRLAAAPAEIVFNYLGQLDRAVAPGAFRGFAAEPAGHTADPRGARAHRLELSGAVRDGCLEMALGYAEGVHRRETIERLAAWYGEALRGLVAHCASPAAGGCTPGDFPLAGLDAAALDALLGNGRGVEDVYPLSPLQEGLLFHSALDPGEGVYVGQLGFALEGELDADALERAWNGAVARHQALRAEFAWEGTPRPLQVIRGDVAVPVRREDWRGRDEAGRRARLEAYLAADRAAGIDPRHAPLMRLALFRTGAREHHLVWTHHHLLLDGWSLPLLFRDVLALYGAHVRGEPARLAPARPYRDYVAWLEGRDAARAEAFWRDALAGFDAPTPLPLARAAGEDGGAAGTGEARMQLPPEGTRALRERARAWGVTANTLVQGAWGLLLARHAGTDDVLFGATVSGRPAALPGVEEMVGLFINALPVRVRTDGAAEVRAWLGDLQARQAAAREHEHTPLVQAQRWSGVPAGEPLFESLVTFENYPVDERMGEGMDALRIRRTVGVETTSYPLVLSAAARDALEVSLVHDLRRIDPADAERLVHQLRTVLEALAARPDGRLAHVSLLTEAERARVLDAGRGETRPFPANARVDAVIAARAAAWPHAPAVASGGRTLSYRELHRRASALAARLRARGVGPETPVALFLDRSAELAVALLAVLRAGGAFVPMDPAYPPERVAYLLADSGAAVVLTRAALAGALPAGTPGVLPVDLDGAADSRAPADRGDAGASADTGESTDVRDSAESADSVDSSALVDSADPVALADSADSANSANSMDSADSWTSADSMDARTSAGSADSRGSADSSASADPWMSADSADPEFCGADALAYLIYTSGSTGRPKAAMVSHRSLLCYGEAMRARMALAPADRVLQFASPAFDVMVEEVFPAWLAGACVVFPREDLLDAPHALLRVLEAERVSIVELPTAFWHEWVRQLADDGTRRPPCLRLVLMGGERVLPERMAQWAATGVPLQHVFGLTETTVTTTTLPLAAGDDGARWPNLPVGTPLANAEAFVLDAGGRPVPAGVPGELYIGGQAVARGYWRRPALTAARYVPHPFAAVPGARLYRTGDRARWLADGTLEFLGRLDQQVKVRGYRVEPAEIEAALARHPAVAEAAVVAREDVPGDRRLVAYVVPAAGFAAGPPPAGAGEDDAATRVSFAELREHLRARLPEHMVPSALVALDALPLTRNGKVDRRALPAPEPGEARPGAAAPRDEREEILCGIWAEVLGVPRVGPRDSFFELGGHSLLAMRVVARIRRALDVEVPLRVLFEAPTVAGLAARIQALRHAEGFAAAPPITPVPRGEPLPASYAQRRLWLVDRMEPGTPAYNMPFALRLRGALDARALRRALDGVVRRHESLRTTFAEHDGEPVQVIHPPSPVPLPVVGLDALPAQAREGQARRLARAQALRPFDLARGPLLRAVLLRLDGDDHVLCLTLHHVVSDGWSTDVLVREVAALYDAFRRGAPAPSLPELPVQYADYAAWQRGWLAGPVLEEKLAWWRGRLAGAPPLLEVPTDHPRAPGLSAGAGSHPVSLSAEASARLRTLARGEGATLFMALLAGWQALLGRYAAQADVVVGTPVAGRAHAEVEGLIGFFVNLLPLRVDLAGDPTGMELLGRVRASALAAYAHPEVPFERLVEDVVAERSLTHAPLFQATFSLERTDAAQAPALAGVDAEPFAAGRGAARFDLELLMADDGGALGGTLVYRAALWEPETAARMAGHLERLLEALAAHPGRPLSTVPLLRDAERARVLEGWSRAPAAPPLERVHDVFARWAA